ncbi:MAG: acyl--CoA ligase [Chloroflexi bacterium]|nr:acyl--CoA ligase [Chloroflexota bacterium]
MDATTIERTRQARTLRGRAPEDYLVPYKSIRHLLEMRARQSPDQVFLISYDRAGQREELTYGWIDAQVKQAANVLVNEMGIRPGDCIATMAHNCADMVVIYLAAWAIGAAVAPQNISEDDVRIEYILCNSQAKVLFVLEDYLERASKIASDISSLREVVQVGGKQRAGYPHFSNLLVAQPSQYPSDREPNLEDEALLVYTSGTTGPPKGVVLTQYNLLVDAWGMAAAQALTGNQRMMCVLPIHHVNGIVVTLMIPLFVGGSVVLNPGYSAGTFWERIYRERVHVVSIVPTILQYCCERNDDMSQYDLSRFRHPICGAGILTTALARRFEQQFGFPIIHGYGLSETTAYCCFLPLDLDSREHVHWMQEYGYPSIGCSLLPCEMDIHDDEGRPLPEGDRGEIVIRGHIVMKHYFQRPEANSEAFKHGWFRSGDEGFYKIDRRGRYFFFITGRIKELVNRGGVKFSPFDIDEILATMPGIKVGLTVAFDNIYYGEEIGAYIVAEEGVRLTSEEVLAYCRQRMPFEKSPKVVVFGQEVPVTATGKYQRFKLKDFFTQWREVQFRSSG